MPLPNELEERPIHVWMPLRAGQPTIAMIDGARDVFPGETPIMARCATAGWQAEKVAHMAALRDARLARRRETHAERKAAEASATPDES